MKAFEESTRHFGADGRRRNEQTGLTLSECPTQCSERFPTFDRTVIKRVIRTAATNVYTFFHAFYFPELPAVIALPKHTACERQDELNAPACSPRAAIELIIR